MKAVVYTKVGKPEESLRIEELAKPSPEAAKAIEYILTKHPQGKAGFRVDF